MPAPIPLPGLHQEPRTREFAELADRLFGPGLDRLLRLKGYRSGSLNQELRTDILHEACVDWLERTAGGWAPPPPGPDRDRCFLQMIGRSHYRIARADPRLRRSVVATPFVSLDEQADGLTAADAPEHEAARGDLLGALRQLPFATEPLLLALTLPAHRRRSFPRAEAVARSLKLQVRTVRRQMQAILGCMGQGGSYGEFWLRRAGEAAFDLARTLLAGCPDLRLADSGPHHGDELLRRRLRRVLRRLAHAALDERQRHALLVARQAARAPGAARARLGRALDAAQATFGATPGILLARAEAARSAGQLDETRRLIDAAALRAHTPAARRLVALARARAAETCGRFGEAARCLEVAELRGARDAVALYDRLAMAALAQRPGAPQGLPLDELAALPAGERTRVRTFLISDHGPFGRRLAQDQHLRRQVLSRLA